MPSSKKNMRICTLGHHYYKSSDCPTCPICEQERKPDSGFLSIIAAPARRALERERITTLQRLAIYSEEEILSLHGIGLNAISKLRSALYSNGLTFKKSKSN